jgi:hypothetical protein
MSYSLASAEKKKGTSLYALFANVCIILLFVTNVFDEKLPTFFLRFDEALAIISLIGILVYLVNKKGKLPRIVGTIATILICLAIVGILGNLISNLQPWIIVLQDAFLFFKAYFVLIFFLLTLNEKRAKEIFRFATKFSKVALVFLAACAVLSYFLDLGMTKNGMFKLFSNFYGAVAVWAILFFAVIYCSKANYRFMYFLLAALVVLMTQSGLGLMMIGVCALVYIFFEWNPRFHWYYVPILAVLAFLVGFPVFKEYFLNPDTPRYLLFYFSFVTMWNFAPIGSGFATYGSAMAAREYSPLYYQYGFAEKYMMSPDDARALQDSFYPIVFAQFGIVGTLLYLAFMIVLFRNFVFQISNKLVQGAAIIVLSTLFIACIGFQAPNAWGNIIFLIFALLVKLAPQENLKDRI